MNKNDSYTVILNSINCITGSTTYNKIFLFDWNQLPNQEYLVYTYFYCIDTSFSSGGYPFLLITTDAFNSLSYENYTKNSNIIGYAYNLHNTSLTNTSYINFSGSEMNMPVYITSIPLSNTFNITITDPTKNTPLVAKNKIGEFMIVMNFVPLKSKVLKLVYKRDIPKMITLKNNKMTYTVVLNTINAVNNSSNKVVDFYVDWSILPDIPYNVYWSFVAGFGGGWLGSYATYPFLNIDCFDLNTYETQYITNTNNNILRKSTRLGALWIPANNNNLILEPI